MNSATVFTVIQAIWALWWLHLHQRIRRERRYAVGRKSISGNILYRIISPFLYVMQNGLFIASFWSDEAWLLKIHDSDMWRTAGFIVFFSGSVLYSWALQHLGPHYSPCYDSYLPIEIVRAGPYRWIRHPMYGAKLLIGAATILVSGSAWFIPINIYFYYVTIRTMLREDSQLQIVPGYTKYQESTEMLIPGII